MRTDDKLEVRVWRGKEAGSFSAYQVPRQNSQTVLDVVTHIQRHLDPTLAYRFACRVGMCGSCAMTVNGMARWTCRTHVAKVADDGAARDRAARQPAGDQGPRHRHARILRQVGAARGPVQGHARRATTTSRRSRPTSPERRAADAGIECIGCGVCYASCDVVAWQPDFLGPAALNRAWTLVNDVARRGTARASARRRRRRRLPRRATRRAPAPSAARSSIAPTRRIAGLKRASRALPCAVRGAPATVSGARGRRLLACAARWYWQRSARWCSRCASSCTSCGHRLCGARRPHRGRDPRRAHTATGRFGRFYAVFVVACAVHVPIGLREHRARMAGARRARRPLARPRVRACCCSDGAALGLRRGGMRRQQRLARARPPGVLGVPDPPPVRPRAGRVPAAALLGARAGAAGRGGARRFSSLHRPAAVQARRVGPGGASRRCT